MPAIYYSIRIDGPRAPIPVTPGQQIQFTGKRFVNGVEEPGPLVWELRWCWPYIVPAGAVRETVPEGGPGDGGYYESGDYVEAAYPADGSAGIVGTISNTGLYTAPAVILPDDTGSGQRGRTTTGNAVVLVYCLSGIRSDLTVWDTRHCDNRMIQFVAS